MGLLPCLPVATVFAAADAGPAAAADRCAALVDARIAATTITRSTMVPANGDIGEHCLVDGYITTPGDRAVPSNRVNFRLGLPTSWNFDLYFQGVGGLVGHLAPLDTGLRRGYASVTTDTGHQGDTDVWGHPELDGRWALGNRPKQIDYAYRGVHVTTVAAKALTRAYYGRTPRKSFLNGCSNGGRQGLMEAQRFPADYDAVISASPAFAATDTFISWIWQAQRQLGSPGSWLSPDAVRALSDASLKATDARDGLVDGLVSDPARARFDPRELVADGSLTKAQAKAARDIYRGPVLSGRDHPRTKGHPTGHEDGWLSYITGRTPPVTAPNGHLVFPPTRQSPAGASFVNEFLRYFVFDDPTYDLTEFDFRTDVPKLKRKLASILDATDPDLSAFKARGGKLLITHGWADPALNGSATVDYYHQVTKKFGTRRTGDFLRLFMVPGMFHCGGGPGPNSFDALTAMERWVHQGKAPRAMLATNAQTGRSRPVCAFPTVALYDGSGSIDRAENFFCGRGH